MNTTTCQENFIGQHIKGIILTLLHYKYKNMNAVQLDLHSKCEK